MAHLWAAFDLFSSARLPEGEGGAGLTYAHLLTSRKEGNLFLTFLTMADSLGRQATEIVPHGQNKPLVSVPELWMPPGDLLKRSPTKGVEVIPTALPPETLEILKARRAPSRYTPSSRRR